MLNLSGPARSVEKKKNRAREHIVLPLPSARSEMLCRHGGRTSVAAGTRELTSAPPIPPTELRPPSESVPTIPPNVVWHPNVTNESRGLIESPVKELDADIDGALWLGVAFGLIGLVAILYKLGMHLV